MGGIQQREDQLNHWQRQSGLGNYLLNDPYGTQGADRIRALFGQFGGTPMAQAQTVNAVGPSAAGRYGDYLANQATRLSSLGTGNQMWQMREQGMNPAMLAAMSGQMAAAGANAAAGAYGQGFGMGMNELSNVNQQNAGYAQQAELANQQARMQALGLQWQGLENMQQRGFQASNNIFNTGLNNAVSYINSRQTPINRGFSSWGPQVMETAGRLFGGGGSGQGIQPSGPGSTGTAQYTGSYPTGTNINDPTIYLKSLGIIPW